MISLSVPLLAAAISLHADTLDGALNRLDKAGSQFKGMSDDFVYVKYTAIVDEKSNSEGSIKIKRSKQGDLAGLLDFTKPDKKLVAMSGQTVEIYLPNMKTVQVVDLGKHKVLLEQFFLFGFGTSRRDLEAAYSVSYGGPESVNGEATTRLVLISKSPEVKKQLSKFELWVSDKTGYPLQQKFYEPSGDYNVFTYSADMKITNNLSDSSLRLPKLPGNVKREMINK
jgi:outer membrane lipoprotein-sorting protein